MITIGVNRQYILLIFTKKAIIHIYIAIGLHVCLSSLSSIIYKKNKCIPLAFIFIYADNALYI
jgi:hypothetical protein